MLLHTPKSTDNSGDKVIRNYVKSHAHPYNLATELNCTVMIVAILIVLGLIKSCAVYII